MKLKARLDTKSLNKLIDSLKSYRVSLDQKRELFISRLLDEGIKVAEENKGFYGSYIIFQKEIDDGETSTVGFLRGKNAKEVISYWNKYGKIKSAAISPILFAEFGSGWLAEVLFDDVTGVGQGTFPEQTHAFDAGGWSYMGLNGEWYHSKGFKPTHPMYKADMELHDKIISIAKEVFRSDI